MEVTLRFVWATIPSSISPQSCDFGLHDASIVQKICFIVSLAFFHSDLPRREPSNQWNFVD